MSFRIISWYTPEYTEIMSNYLGHSLTALCADPSIDIRYNIYRKESKADWKHNTNLKPFVIEEALNNHDESIVVLDADSRLLEYPKLFDMIPIEYDCAFFYLNWDEWYGNGSKTIELCSGTLFFRNREICMDLVREWQAECKKNKYPDQKNLEIALKKFQGIIKIYKLPYEYCWISDLPNGKQPLVKRPENIVIEHFQSSRYMRTEVIKGRKK